MKIKTQLVSLILVFLSVASFAQSQGDVRAGAGLGFGFSPFGGDGALGFGANFEYVFKSGMSGSLEYYSYTKDSFTTNVLGIDYRYYFVTGDTQVYGSAGLTNLGGDVDGTLSLSLGAGAIFPLSGNLGAAAALNYNMAKPDGANDPFGFNMKGGVVYSF
ncbi:MAG: hypothetical protein RLN88_00515 [Ekhidna sp.]|uniref:hypothetical protein n=1 Tax=Ekhidna sp. TaxID=2608089 RepID=UPI0032ECDEAD